MNTRPTLKTLKILFLSLTSLFILGCTEKPDDPVDTSKPKETITLERAHEMYKSYQERYNALTEFRGGKEDSRYGWHSLDFYENYIAYLKHESAKVGIEVSGIRLYYAAYPENRESGAQQGYQTYLYVPTYYDKETKKHIAFDPLHVENGKPLSLHQVITKGKTINKQTSSMMMFQGGTGSSIANMAQMCQPNCSEAGSDQN
ncbi:MAG: hypothetical protein AAF149_20635 [Bacteroidota bacterium]